MRRLTSLLSIFAIVALVLMLFWRVYFHHQTTSVRGLDVPAGTHVKIATPAP